MRLSTNFRSKKMKKILVVGALALLPVQAMADLVPGGSGSPASFPSGASFAGGVTGVTDGSAASAGEVGEVLSSDRIRGSRIVITEAGDGSPFTIVPSLTLTAGVWLISGNMATEDGGGETEMSK